MVTMEERIKERRRDLLKRLKHRSDVRQPFSRRTEDHPFGVWEHGDEHRGNGYQKWLWQTPVSVLLLLTVMLSGTVNHPYAEAGQAWVKEVLTREFNFAGIERWYNERFAGAPSLLPALYRNNSSLDTNAQPNRVYSPISGQVLTAFQGKGITIQPNTKGKPIVAMSKGWVTYVGEMEDLGLTVIIRHSEGRETWYSWLKEAYVKPNDVVAGGDPIGSIAQDEKGEEGLFYFSIKENNQFTDPLGVVQFDD